MERCPLCKSDLTVQFADKFYECGKCKGVFRSKYDLLSSEMEKERYLLHKNDIEDAGYRRFVSPVTEIVLKNFTTKCSGLDFGAGTNSAVSKILEENGYKIAKYDPYFHNDPKLLESDYDFIVCCEVIEHFHSPDIELSLLKKLLKKDGQLICMTAVYDCDIDFKNWYYKNDRTHVFFYSRETFEWIRSNWDFGKLSIDNRLVIFSK